MIILVEKVTKIAAIACNLKKTSKKCDFLTYDSNKGVKISWNICFLIPFLTLSHIYMYKLVNKIQIGHSELLKLGKKLILRKTLIFIIFGLLFLDFRFYIDYDVIWVKIVHKHKPIYANYWFQWQKKYNIAKKKLRNCPSSNARWGGQPKRSAWPLFHSFFFEPFPKGSQQN